MNLSTPDQIKAVLHAALGKLEKFEQCALLGHPAHPNIGDHLIWLGEVSYLTDVLKADINYTAHIYNFCVEEMKKQVVGAPILLSGGGNLGDLWPYYQEFRERVVTHCHDQPIIILPQTIYFSDRKNLVKAANIFNAHPNLTLFVRDNYSYEIALKFFYDCQIIQAPDMAFQLVDTSVLSVEANSVDFSTLYLCRQDKELNSTISLDPSEFADLVVEDWVSYTHQGDVQDQQVASWIPWNLSSVVRDVWQGNRTDFVEWIDRKGRHYFHPYISRLSRLYNPSRQSQSWNFRHNLLHQFSQYRCRYRKAHMQRQSYNYTQDGVRQLSQHRLVITNRLHGHIFCVLLGIPHIFLPNAYYKNQVFYESWTAQIPFCRFVKQASKIKEAIQELSELYPISVDKN